MITYVHSMSKRRYTLRQRADAREETRHRIVAAAARLHEEVGPRSATISAIAEKAGVQRLTVYRHFPNETELFKACTAHWLARNAPPDPASWRHRNGLARVREGLVDLYRYYRRTERMWQASYRDEADVAALKEPMRQVRDYLAGVSADLAGRLAPELESTDPRRATLAHAVQFHTWQSLARQGLDDAFIGDLVCGWLRGADGRRRREGALRQSPSRRGGQRKQ